MKLLCLSNGHGEDEIAVRILRELQKQHPSLEIAALPLVGEGRTYAQLENVPIIGSVQQMPSGGFIYMDAGQLWRDVQGGLLQLTWAQLQTVRAWSKQGGTVLAVGDIVPLLFAWLSGAPYAFVGTAKSEYYLQDEGGYLSSKRRWEGWSGSVYLPWERWLMRRPRCKAVFPRDRLTTEILQKFKVPAYDLGNPMMDDLQPENPVVAFYGADMELREVQRSLTITLLPGSRIPEAYANWQLILEAVAGLMQSLQDRKLLFLGAIAPSLNLEALTQALEVCGWRQEGRRTERRGSILRDPIPAGQVSAPVNPFPSAVPSLTFTQKKATLILTQHNYNDCLHQGDLAIAMAGTATEQFIGLGKPAIAFPGPGPQFTAAFAEAQSRLLGPSLILVNGPHEVTHALQFLLREPDRLQLIAENGKRRMGQPGAARRIATCLSQRLCNLSVPQNY